MDKKIREIERKLNNRPRKVLDFKMPFEMFFHRQTLPVVGCNFDALHL
ncbi:MAG: hypothetical protein LBJ71_01275 [Holosporaceae bacterium]|jgi:IS30 family transposase|nr:hypothetical protein [Holosporaceae bacterium]